MGPAELGGLLRRLAPALDALDAPWAVIGSGAQMILGLPIAECPDLDILTSEAAAERLETLWAPHRIPYTPKPGPFRSRFSRYGFPEGAAEVLGGLELATGEGWRRVEPGLVERRPFGGGSWPVPSPADQLRILAEFGRPKDLERAVRLEAFLAAG